MLAFLIGVGGEKVKKVEFETSCLIQIRPTNWKMGEYLQINIKPNIASNHHGVIGARDMIVKSLLEFLVDKCAKGKLLYQLAASSSGKFRNERSDSGVVHQRSHFSTDLTLMKLVNLPRFFLNQETRDSVQTTTGCSVEMFSHYDAQLKRLMPHALVWGENCEQVEKAAAIVTDAVDSGTGSNIHCEGILRKRNSMSDNIRVSANSNSCESSERPRKLLKREMMGRQSNQQYEDDDLSHCLLTVPAWLTDSKKNFFCK